VSAVAREFRLDETMANEARARALRILQGEGAWAWGRDLLWQGSEVELVHQGQLFRLDRLVRHPQTGWWVLDHKSASRPEDRIELVAQLQAYRQAVRALQGEPVRAAFLTAEGRLAELAEGAA
jgi:ATP-dependent helicase/nuclease subunit A